MLSLSTTLLFAAVALPVLLAWLLQPKSKIDAPRVGIAPGILSSRLLAARQDFARNGHRLIAEGYHKYPNDNFIVQMQDSERLIIFPKYLEELRMVPESRLSHTHALVEKHLGTFYGLDVIIDGTRQHADVCRVNLTQSLPRITPIMAHEIQLAIAPNLHASLLYGTCRNFQGLRGADLCHDPEWLDIASSYLREAVTTADTLRPWPPFLRTFVRPFVKPKKDMDQVMTRALKLFGPALRQRRESRIHEDILQYLVDSSKNDEDLPLLLKFLSLVAASIHTSTLAAVNAVYDMCSRPEYIPLLREEVQKALQNTEGIWKDATVKQLNQLDSFFKESMRYSPADALGFMRKALQPIKLSDGKTTIPKGMMISMAAASMSRDSKFYESPEDFNPRRFFDPAGNQPINPSHTWTGIENGNIIWGNGRQTCPGRWYAALMDKLIVGMLLASYDFRFAGNTTIRPSPMYNDGTIIPSPTQQIELRRLF